MTKWGIFQICKFDIKYSKKEKLDNHINRVTKSICYHSAPIGD